MSLTPAAILYDSTGTNPVSIITDSGVYRVSTEGKLLNVSGTQVNPATEETLDSIKDTDGIKKITDALPAGTNLLGKVQIRNPGNTVDLGDSSNPVRIDPTGTTTQPMSASSLPLPTGAATETTLSSADGKLTTIDSVLGSIKDTDGIKKITDALPVGDNNIGRVKITDGTNVAGLILDGSIYRQQVEVKQASGDYTNVRIADGDSSTLADVIQDSEDSVNRLQIKGKVSVSAPQPPSTATAVTLASDNPLDITGTEENDYTIPEGETFTLTSVIAGAEGDPTEKGSKIEVIYDQNGTETIIDRIYLTGQTVAIYPDTSKDRSGNSLDGNAGGTNKIVLRRTRLSGSAQEVDAVLRGYVQ